MSQRKATITITQNVTSESTKSGKFKSSVEWEADFSEFKGTTTQCRDDLFANLERFVQELKTKVTD